jgi:hypothetical protein
MNLSKSILLTFLLILIISCSLKKHEESNDKLIHVNMESQLDSRNKDKKSLSVFIDTVIYLPLESIPNSYLGKIRDVILYKDNYYVLDNSNLFKFNNTGKFVCQIGKRGRGPGEHRAIGDIIIKNDTIFMNSGSIMTYDINGNFLEKYPYPFRMFFPHDIQRIGNDFVAMNKNGFINFINKQGIIIDSINYEKYTQELSNSTIELPLSGIFFGTRNSMKISTFYNDTLFEISSKHNLIPKYVLNLGKYKLPEENRINYKIDFSKNQSLLEEYLRPVPLETKNYLLIQFRKWLICNIPPFGLTGKKIDADTQGLGIFDKRNENFSIIDVDWKYYPCFYPYFTDGERTLISFVNAYDAIDFYKKNQVYSEMYKPFISMVNNINTNDNPILIVMKLKD